MGSVDVDREILSLVYDERALAVVPSSLSYPFLDTIETEVRGNEPKERSLLPRICRRRLQDHVVANMERLLRKQVLYAGVGKAGIETPGSFGRGTVPSTAVGMFALDLAKWRFSKPPVRDDPYG